MDDDIERCTEVQLAEEDQQRNRPIEPPAKHRAGDMTRSVSKAVIGSIPGAGAFLAEAADQFLPDATARDRERWEGEITNSVNGLQIHVAAFGSTGSSAVPLSRKASAIGVFVARECPEGMGDYYIAYDDMAAALPEFSADDLADGLGELEALALIVSSDWIGSDETYAMTDAGYGVFDQSAMGWNTAEDARTLAAWALEQGDTAEMSLFQDSSAWSVRRINPALALVLARVDSENVSKEVPRVYHTNYFYMSKADRARLRRYVGASGT